MVEIISGALGSEILRRIVIDKKKNSVVYGNPPESAVRICS
jgi:hypothetical protein